MPPILRIVGKSGVGKTRVIETLLPELQKRGYQVATMKHHIHRFNLDIPGKDSWRHAQAGAEAVLLSSPEETVLMKRANHDASPEELARLLGSDYDLILAEGFKSSPGPRIEVHRKEAGPDLLTPPEALAAVVTDEPLNLPVWQCSFEEMPRLAEFLEETFLQRQEDKASLWVNGLAIPLNSFVQSLMAKTVLGMVAALKGPKKAKSLDLSIRKKS